ncbi:hypothetical protein AAMO2058_001010900 [Amorphochlora amoebiformis]
MGNPLEVVFVLLFATYGIAAGSISSESDDIFLFIDDITVASIHEQGERVDLMATDVEDHPNHIHVRFEALERSISITASRNRNIFHPEYKEASLRPDGSYEITKNGGTQCYYVGSVENTKENVFMSTCKGGLDGVIGIDGFMFEIQFLPKENRHRMFNISDHPDIRASRTCDTLDEHHHLGAHGLVPPPGVLGESRDSLEESQDSKVREMAVGECLSSPNKIVDVLIINDQRRFELRGTDTETSSALIFSYMFYFYRGGTFNTRTFPGIQDIANGQECTVTLRLRGQITYRSGNPSDFEYSTGPNCAANCVTTTSRMALNEDNCGENQISATCLLNSISYYLQSNLGGIEAIFGDIDQISLFSETNFAGSSGGDNVGLAWVGAMCSNGFSSSVNEVTSSSSYINGVLASHEMGHNFNMGHDDIQGFVMFFALSGQPVAFSSLSKTNITEYFETVYGSLINPTRCLEGPDPGFDTWNSIFCGNGKVDIGEDCDPGFGSFGGCCLSNCSLGLSCDQCDPSQICCNDAGFFRPSSFVCRSANHSSCDFEETCTGSSGICPIDLFESAGTTCSDVTSQGVSGSGLCYSGECVTLSDNCQDPTNRNAYIFTGNEADACSQLRCRPDSSTVTGFGVTQSIAGTPCGASSQCDPMGVCVNSSSLKFFHWALRNTSSCYVCRDETGTEVASANCETSSPGVDCENITPSPTASPNQGGGGNDSSQILGVQQTVFIIAVSVVGSIVLIIALWFTCRKKKDKKRKSRRGSSKRRRKESKSRSKHRSPVVMAKARTTPFSQTARSPQTHAKKSPARAHRSKSLGGRGTATAGNAS